MSQSCGVHDSLVVSVLPCHSLSAICALQEADPVLKDVLMLWRRRVQPTLEEKQQVPKPVLLLLKQWDCLVEKQGVLYCRFYCLDGGEEIRRLVLPALLQQETLKQLHQEHGHHRIESTSEIVCQHCYWSGMSTDIK